jgi:hypothetical protein
MFWKWLFAFGAVVAFIEEMAPWTFSYEVAYHFFFSFILNPLHSK